MYVSPRPTDSLKSLPTQKFLFVFPISFFFISGISDPFRPSLFPFLYFTIAEASVDTIAGMVLKHAFRLLLVEMMASYKKRPRTWKIVIIELNSFEKTFWWSCKYISRSKKFTCPFGLVPIKFFLSDGWITCPGLRASWLRRRLYKATSSSSNVNSVSFQICCRYCLYFDCLFAHYVYMSSFPLYIFKHNK